MSAAAVSAAPATVEAATAANCAAAANCFTAADCAAVEAAGNCAASDRATVPAITVAATITGTTVEAAVEPRAGADKQATGEVARAVVSVRRAGVRVIPIVAVSADRSGADIARTDAHADCDALGISVRS